MRQTGPIASYQVLQQDCADLQAKLDAANERLRAAEELVYQQNKTYNQLLEDKQKELDLLRMAYDALEAKRK